MVEATAAHGRVSIPVRTEAIGSAQATEIETLGRLWAREKIEWLEGDLWANPNGPSRESIRRLGLDYHLVTPFTSLLAVDYSRRVGEGKPELVVQPVEVPEDVDAVMSGAAAPPAPSDIAEEMDVDFGARGCFCRVGIESAPRHGAWLALLGIAVAFLRRRSTRV